jgi:NAD(P)-dependent dehydrogenase (short-subunit alcohol dehydrogenase family)
LVADLPPLDVLFNCAGFVHNGSILDATDAEWDFAFNLNVRAQFWMIQAVLPGMLANGGGSIINMASVCGSLKGLPNRFHLRHQQGRSGGPDQGVAADYVAKGIRCNAIAPGTVDTPSLATASTAMTTRSGAQELHCPPAHGPAGAGARDRAHHRVPGQRRIGVCQRPGVCRGRRHDHMNQLDFKGRHAVITGGRHRPGLCDCAAPAGVGRQRVAVGPRRGRSRKAAQQLGQGRRPWRWMCRAASVAAAVQATLAHAGRIDALVNSAGITGPNTKVWDYPVDAWRQVMDINLTGCSSAAASGARTCASATTGASSTSRRWPARTATPMPVPTAPARPRVMALTKSLGKELADTGMRVNCVTPAAVKTAIFDQMTPEHIPSCCPKSPWAASARPRRWPPWWAGCAPKTVLFPPARCLTCPVADPLIEHPRSAFGASPSRGRGQETLEK